MGIFDNFLGGGMFGGNVDPSVASLYGDVLTPQQQQAVAARGLAGFLGGMQRSGALDYTVPFISGKVPGGLAAGLAGGAAGAAEAQDKAGLNALNASLLGLKGQELKNTIAIRNALLQKLGIGSPATGMNGPSVSGPSTGPTPDSGGAAMPGGQDSAAPPMEAGGALSGASVSGSLSPADVKQLAYQAGFKGDDADKATAIVMAESSGNPNAANENGEHSYGLSQINADAWGPVAKTALGNPVQAMRLMYQISQGGTDFSPWSTFKNGAYKQYLGDARKAPAPTPLLSGNAMPPAQLEQAGPLQAGALGGPSPAAISNGAVPQPAQPSALPVPQTAAPAMPTRLGGININDPNQVLALGALADMAGMPSLGTLLTGTPQYKGLVAGAEANAQNQSKLNFAPKLAPFEDPYTKAALAAQLYPPGSPERAMAEANMARAAGLKPILGGERPGVPIRQYNPATGQYEITAQNPRVAEGQTFNQNGVVSNAPGYVPSVSESTAAKAAAEQRGKIAAENEPIAGQNATSSGNSPQIAIPGTKIAPDMTSVVPTYKEPAYTANDIKANQPEWAKQNAEMSASIGQAQFAEHQLANIADAFKMIQTGAYTTDKAAFNATMMAVFGKDTGIQLANSDPGQVEKALHENYRQTLQTLAAANKRFAQSEFLITSENSEHPNLQPEANLAMLSEDIGRLRQTRAMATDWAEARIAGYKDPEIFQTKWLAANPLSPIADAVKKEIGPLKGMSGGPGSPPQNVPAGVPPGSQFYGHSPSTGLNYFKGPDGKIYSAKP